MAPWIRPAAFLVLFAGLTSSAKADLIISEVVAGTTFEVGWVELYNSAATELDISSYKIANYNPTIIGTGTALSGTLAAGATYVVAYQPAGCGLPTNCFEEVYSVGDPDQVISSAAEIAAMNGIYAVAILDSSNAVIDVYGTPGVAATAAWDYTDSYASRCTREQEETFAAADWTIPGPNTLAAITGCDQSCQRFFFLTPGSVPPCPGECANNCSSTTSCTVGLTSTSALGGALLAIDGNCNLEVSNIGSSGSDCFSQDPLPAASEVIKSFPLGANFGASVMGARMQLDLFATLPITGTLVATTSVENTNGTTLTLTASFPNMGATQYKVQLLDSSGSIVSEYTGGLSEVTLAKTSVREIELRVAGQITWVLAAPDSAVTIVDNSVTANARQVRFLAEDPTVVSGTPPDFFGTRLDHCLTDTGTMTFGGSIPGGPEFFVYCVPGTSAGGCSGLITATGTPSSSANFGFDVRVINVEGSKQGLVFFGTNGRQANPWGNTSSFVCVVAPVIRTGTASSGGASGTCGGVLALDFNNWMTINPPKAPPVGTFVDMQGWYRDPNSTSFQKTSMSDALEFNVYP